MLFSKLVLANQGILRQKIDLIEALIVKHGENQAQVAYSKSCPITKASIGQHFRHSMDHIERVARIASNPDLKTIHYDVRERGVADEHDLEAAVMRVDRVMNMFIDLDKSAHPTPVFDRQINAAFMFTESPNRNDQSTKSTTTTTAAPAVTATTTPTTTEYSIPSTLARELGFSAHHAVHHLAMVRLIAITTGALADSDIPHDFGKAPSTLNFEKTS